MKQQDLGLNLSKRRTRKAVFLDEMNLVVPWSELLALIAPHAPRAKTGRPPFELETMLRIHFVQQWFGLSDLAMEEGSPSFRVEPNSHNAPLVVEPGGHVHRPALRHFVWNPTVTMTPGRRARWACVQGACRPAALRNQITGQPSSPPSS